MTSGQKFCTECGALLIPDNRFCGQCGSPVAGLNITIPPAATHTIASHQTQVPQVSGTYGAPERIIGIVPFLEQGIISVIHYTLLVTSEHLIFCTWSPDTDESMSDADDEMTLESCNIAETKDEIAHFHAKNWANGPWQKYLSMPINAIVANAPGSIIIPLTRITGVDIVCETMSSTQDKLFIDDGGPQKAFDLMYSQGPFLFNLLQPLLAEKVRMANHLHKRRSLDRLLTGQEYK